MALTQTYFNANSDRLNAVATRLTIGGTLFVALHRRDRLLRPELRLAGRQHRHQARLPALRRRRAGRPDRDPAHAVLGQTRRLVLRAPRVWPCPSTPARSPSSTSSPASSPPRWRPGSSAPSARASRPRPSSWRRWRYRGPAAFEVIVRVMAAGVNFNNVWAALGKPVSVFRYHEEDHHIGGSDASGIVWAVGEGVTRWKPGDEVVVHCNQASLRGRRGPRARPAGRAVAADLGLRDDLGLVRAVLQGPGPAAAAQAARRWRGRRRRPTG